MINGIETREFGNSGNNFLSKKKSISNKNLEDTKINFFDPSKYKDIEEELVYEKKEEDQMIEGKVDPQEWRKEVERVYRDLDNIERDVQLIRTRG